MNTTNILLRHGFINAQRDASTKATAELATILMNLEYYGYNLSVDAFKAVKSLSIDNLYKWWKNFEPELKSVTGDDRNIGDFVVYKNFPAEVLSKSEFEYWLPQLLMYWGFPNDLFTEPVKPRDGMDPSERKSKTLMLSNEKTLGNIFGSLLNSSEHWTDVEFQEVIVLSKTEHVDLSKIKFKENLVKLGAELINQGLDVQVKTATDVLRLAAALSDGDVSLREKVHFKSFDRKTRRFFMNMLLNCNNLEEDVARRKNVWKKFLHQLHPGEFQKSHAKVVKIANELYNDRLQTFNSKVEKAIKTKDVEALNLLTTRPGEFSRRLVNIIDVFGNKGTKAFIKIIPKLTVNQIVTLQKFLETCPIRTKRIFPPKGNWARLQIAEPRSYVNIELEKITVELGKNLSKRVPAVSLLDGATDLVKLPNGNDEGSYARGTVFIIPEEVKFIRTASYWEKKRFSNVWFDNGWNFFDKNWESQGSCCWTEVNFNNGAAIFSGDPTNSKEMLGRAAQLIDIYPEKLLKCNVRYAVWNILCFSKIPFSKANDVFAALQWGKDPQKGKLFEPSRCQLSFKLTGEYYTKYVCIIDLEKYTLRYADLNLKAKVYSAEKNDETLSKQMPAVMEYFDTLPSVYDLFKNSVKKKTGNGQVLYSSKDVVLNSKQPAYVFQHESKQDYKPIDINKILIG